MQVGTGFQPVRFGGLDQGVEIGAGLYAFNGGTEQPVLSPDHKRSNRILSPIVVDLQATIVQVADQFTPLIVRVSQGVARGAHRWHLR